MYLKKKESTAPQSPKPIKYPAIPPKTDPIAVYKANLQDLVIEPKQRAISRTSGGMGKKELSANANKKRASEP